MFSVVGELMICSKNQLFSMRRVSWAFGIFYLMLVLDVDTTNISFLHSLVRARLVGCRFRIQCSRCWVSATKSEYLNLTLFNYCFMIRRTPDQNLIDRAKASSCCHFREGGDDSFDFAGGVSMSNLDSDSC